MEAGNCPCIKLVKVLLKKLQNDLFKVIIRALDNCLHTTETEMSSNFFEYCKHNPVKEYLMPHIQMVEYPLNTNKNAPVTSVGPTFHMSIKGEEADNSSDGKCVNHE